MPAKGVFPLRENCDPKDPEEFCLWAFAAPPGVNGGQFIMPIDVFRRWSQRFWDLGFRQVEEPILEYVGPAASEPNWATSAGRWVPAGTVTDDDRALQAIQTAVARMGHQQKVELYTALQAWEAGDGLPESVSGRVVQNMLDIEPHLLPIALTVLRGLHDAA